ncbi:pseudouridine synthase [Flavobacteriaceae bacterium Ap0902]|nr:pseudouridine synthase [Flavobacteriaceae bacterium Ap0902]
MRKKNPSFNQDNKTNRSDADNSSQGRRSSGGRRSRSNDRSRRDNKSGREERPNREGRPFNSKRRDSSDRKPSRGDRPNRGSRTSREERPFSSKRRESSDRKPSRGDRPDRGSRTSREERPFNSKRRESSDRRPSGGDRPDRESRIKKEDRPFGGDRSTRGSGIKQDGKLARETRRDFKRYQPKTRKPEVIKENDGLIRLNKYVANAGICSRRQADEYIRTGVVEVNGVTITEMGYKVKPEDDVRFDGERISPEKKTYLLLNKPKGFITTTHDERDRKTVMDLVAGATTARLFPVGRLDRQTTGVLLFTNDGHMAKKLTHPSHGVKKIYHVILDNDLYGDDMEKIRNGIPMQEGVAKVDKISYIQGKGHNEIGVEIHIGWNRVVRRIFEKLGYKVMALDRVEFAGLTKKTLKRGDYRILDAKEVNFLKMI